MSKVLYFLICIVLVLFMAGNVSAAEIEWNNNNGEGDRLWDTALNWDTNTVPTLAGDDTAIMDFTYTDDGNGPIIQNGVDAECGWLEMGYHTPPKDEVVLTMTGGTLTNGSWIDVGGYKAGHFRFDMSGGDVTVIGQDGDPTWEGLWLAFFSEAQVVMNVSGGDLEVFGGLWLGWDADSYGLFNMTGGTYTGTYVYIGTWEDWGGAGRLNLHGGTMHCEDFCMGPWSQMDITEGVLTCDTDLTVANGWLFDPCSDTPVSGPGNGVRDEAPGYTGTLEKLVELGWVTAYDAAHGEVITDDVNFPAEVGKRSVVIFDYDVRNADKTTLMAATVDPNLAWNPKPFDGKRGFLMPYLSHTGFISWSAGNGAAGHELYFGTDFDAVNNATPGSDEHVDTKSLEDVNDTFTLKWGHTYYWRVDEVNGGTTWKGDVWTFTVEEGKALAPNPADGQKRVPIEVELDWMPGGEAVSHELYFSSDFDEVNDRSISCYSAPGANSHDPGILQLGTTYYWAVDEVNTAAEVTTWPGDVWSFKTDDHIVVDYFDSYADDAEMQDVWCDWYCNEDSGTVVYVMTDSNYTYDDGNSMRFEYDNDYYAYSNAYAAMADLGISSNWLARGAEALHLVFMGDSDNQVASGDSMYVSVEDTDGDMSTVEYHDINDLQDDSWHDWHIDFEELMSSNVDLDLTDVSRIYLDISGSSTGYEVYFDNIGLWSPYCRWDISRPHGDFDGDCDTDSYDMGIMAQTWLMTDSEAVADPPVDLPLVWYKFDEGSGKITDNSGDGGSSLDGTFKSPSDPSWDDDGAPAIGSEDPNYSLLFDGSDKVEVPELNLNSNTVTISAWIKRNGPQLDWAGIVFSRDKDSCAGLSIGENLELKYHWNGDSWWWDSGMIVPDSEWVFAALVVEPTQAMICMSDGITFSSATNIVEHDIEEFNGLTQVGLDGQQSSFRYFEGLIDDVRIYDRALDMGEILGLSGMTGTYYVPLNVPSNIVVKDPPGGPYNEDNKDIVNLRDYAAFADGWLGTVLWP